LNSIVSLRDFRAFDFSGRKPYRFVKQSNIEPSNFEKMTKLSVNINKIATIRNARGGNNPDLIKVALDCERFGAQGITVHPRPDERHTRRSDLPELRALIDDEFPSAEFNIEGYPDEAFLRLVEANQPDQVTLVPDDPAQPTSDHGWDFEAQFDLLAPVVKRLKQGGFRVSLFANPDVAGMDAAKATGADRVELYTGPYGGCEIDSENAARELELLGKAAEAARAQGLDVNAGHDLTVANLPALARRIPDLVEVSIGHGLTADALEFAMSETVRRFLRACGW